MGYTYEWKINSIKKATTNDVSNAITNTYWKVTATDEDGDTGDFNGATPFKLSEIDSDNFTDYHDLTESQVIGWIQNVVSGSNMSTNYWDHIQAQIDKQILRKKITLDEVSDVSLPWSPTSGSVTPTPPEVSNPQAAPNDAIAD